MAGLRVSSQVNLDRLKISKFCESNFKNSSVMTYCVAKCFKFGASENEDIVKRNSFRLIIPVKSLVRSICSEF